jgi:hypothetical protein
MSLATFLSLAIAVVAATISAWPDAKARLMQLGR